MISLSAKLKRLFVLNAQSINNILIATATAIALASWVIYLQHGWITTDSILYFEMAKHISTGDFQAAYEVEKYSWFLYPALISLVHLVTGFSLQMSANILIVLFFVTLVAGLLRLVSILGGGALEQAFAVLMLFAARYIIGDILPMASRDLGYWAIMLWAVNYLILFYQHGKLIHAFNWQILAIFAMLFRIEGAVQLLVLPLFGFVFTTELKSVKSRFAPYILVLFASFLMALILLIKGANLEHLGRIKELATGVNEIKQNFNANLVHRVDIMRMQVIGEPFKEFAWFSFLLAYLSIITIKCLTVAGLAPVMLAWSQKSELKQKTQPIAFKFLCFWLFVSWLIACLIAFKVNLLSGRYVSLFGIVLIALASFSYVSLFKSYRDKKLPLYKKAVLGVVCAIVFLGILGNVWPKTEGYHYEIDAVNYVKQQARAGERILYSSPRQRFYADAAYEGRLHDEWEMINRHITYGTVKEYQYLVIKLDATPENKPKEIFLDKGLKNQFTLDRVFYGYKNKKRILIFKKVFKN